MEGRCHHQLRWGSRFREKWGAVHEDAGDTEVETPPHPGAAGHPDQVLRDMVVWSRELGPLAHGWWAALTNSVPGTPRMAPVRNGRSGSSSLRHGRTMGCPSTRRRSWLSCGESRLATHRTQAPSWSTAGTQPPPLHSRLPSALCPSFCPGPWVPPDGPLHLYSAGVSRPFTPGSLLRPVPHSPLALGCPLTARSISTVRVWAAQAALSSSTPCWSGSSRRRRWTCMAT